ncbi:MAG: nickel insertion protein [Terriglobales bacterium]
MPRGAAPVRESILMIEASLDDCSPQIIGYVLERALELGALDAYTTAAQMKKFRPGVVVTLLARPQDRETLVALLLRETTTLGVRVAATERWVLPREVVRVATEFGEIRVKRAGERTGEKAAAEYDDCRAAARRHDVPILQVMRAAVAKLQKH